MPGQKKQAYENCNGVVFSELSLVDTPADPRAVANEAPFSLSASKKMSRKDLIELVAFSKVNANRLPKVVANMIEEVLSCL